MDFLLSEEEKREEVTMPKRKENKARTTVTEGRGYSENNDPNVHNASILQKHTNSPTIVTVKSKQFGLTFSKRTGVSTKEIRERRFIVAKRDPKTLVPDVVYQCNEITEFRKKCPDTTYKSVSSSQNNFFQKRVEEERRDFSSDEREERTMEEFLTLNEEGSSRLRRKMRSRVLEDAMNSIPDTGDGRVKHLVKAFERLLSLSERENLKQREETTKITQWGLPGLQLNLEGSSEETERKESVLSSPLPSLGTENNDAEMCSSLSSVGFFFQAKKSEPSFRVDSSTDDNERRFDNRVETRRTLKTQKNLQSWVSSRTGRNVSKQIQTPVTNQRPFNLRTEQRGKMKTQEFTRKLEKMLVAEDKLRKPIAQGLPWTTDHPECLVRPPVKESTWPTNINLHSRNRAVERAEFNHHIAQRSQQNEQCRLEKQRMERLEEEEEIRRLRRRLIPRAQPMPYFGKPFVPQRSKKLLTVPQEPKFQVPKNKKIRGMPLNDKNALNPQDVKNKCKHD